MFRKLQMMFRKLQIISQSKREFALSTLTHVSVLYPYGTAYSKTGPYCA